MDTLSLPIASVAVLLGFAYLAWRIRALERGESRRIERAATREEELVGIAGHATDLLAGSSLTVYAARRALEENDIAAMRELLDEANHSLRGLECLFRASRVYARGRPDDHAIAVMGPVLLEGPARLAVAITRSRAPGVGIVGAGSDVLHTASTQAALALLISLIEQCRATLSDGHYVEVRLQDRAIEIVGGREGELVLEPLEGTARALALRLRSRRVDGRLAVIIDALPGARATVAVRDERRVSPLH